MSDAAGLFGSLLVIVTLLGCLFWGLRQERMEQQAALDQCRMQVRGGQKKAIDCRLMKMEFEIQNERTRANMATGAAVGAAVGAGMASR